MSRVRLTIHWTAGFYFFCGLLRLILRAAQAAAAYTETGISGVKAAIMHEAFQFVDYLWHDDGFVPVSWKEALWLQFFLASATALCGVVFFRTRRPKKSG